MDKTKLEKIRKAILKILSENKPRRYSVNELHGILSKEYRIKVPYTALLSYVEMMGFYDELNYEDYLRLKLVWLEDKK